MSSWFEFPFSWSQMSIGILCLFMTWEFFEKDFKNLFYIFLSFNFSLYIEDIKPRSVSTFCIVFHCVSFFFPHRNFKFWCGYITCSFPLWPGICILLKKAFYLLLKSSTDIHWLLRVSCLWRAILPLSSRIPPLGDHGPLPPPHHGRALDPSSFIPNFNICNILLPYPSPPSIHTLKTTWDHRTPEGI